MKSTNTIFFPLLSFSLFTFCGQKKGIIKLNFSLFPLCKYLSFKVDTHTFIHLKTFQCIHKNKPKTKNLITIFMLKKSGLSKKNQNHFRPLFFYSLNIITKIIIRYNENYSKYQKKLQCYISSFMSIRLNKRHLICSNNSNM